MSDIESEVSTSLRTLAESWLKRPLITTELAQLEQFQRDWGNATASGGASQGGMAPAAPVSGDPAAQVRQQAAQAVSEAKQRSESAIRDVLKKLQGTTAQALQAHESEEQAILRIVEAARSLNDLRPSVLNLAASGAPPSAQVMLPQIADRLVNLIKTEVDQCFERHFGPLQRQLAAVIEQHNAAAQSAASSSTQQVAAGQTQPAQDPNSEKQP
jgi:hypothetical protein